MSENKQGWISVKDELPEEDGTYITFIKTKVYQSIGFTLFTDNEFTSSFVTHWMPFPNPPVND